MSSSATAGSSKDSDGPPAAKKTTDRAAARQPSTSGAADSPARKPRLLSTVSANKTGGVVEGRVVSRTAVTPWSKKEGKTLSFILIDQSARIQVVAFNEEAERYSSKIQEHACVRISGFRVKPANPSFRATEHAFDLVFTSVRQVLLN